MATFTRQVVFSGFQFLSSDQLTAYGVRDRLSVEVPNLIVYDVHLTEGSEDNMFVDDSDFLQIVQYHIVDGERSNVVHELHSGDWLIEDVFAEEGWRVVSNDELGDIIS